ncbi:MarR family winged helix-turn-helix transcriptional regulator [Cryptosporangium japonicum]|uniref:MarR family winged helix-turn-helix transcriptional regulator n=1 Tax=Cryptosporangium japonicum TaxID=80872 RepID=A0ABP3EPU8_9ACTN
MSTEVDAVERAVVAMRRSMTRRTFARAAGHGESAATYEVLDVVEASGDRATVSSVATALQVDQPRASRLVAAAVEAGWLVRVADQSDGRRAFLARTEAGKTVSEHVHGFRRSMVASAMTAWSDEERATFARLLTDFVAQLPGTTSPDS